MSSPFMKELGLFARNNEAIDEVFVLKHKVAGVIVPFDLTGYEFQAQARKGRNKTSPLICNLTVEAFGDPSEGRIHVTAAEGTISVIEHTRGYWDLLLKSDDVDVDNLFLAPFEISFGITEWSE